MKPHTKAHNEVMQLREQLRPLTAKERCWALKHVPYFTGHASYGKVTCQHCGHVFEHNGKDEQRCPHCKRTLHITQTKKESADDIECFVLMDAVEQWQVMRYFHVITQSRKRGTKTSTRISEIMQRWIGADGKYVIVAKQRNICFYNIRWVYDSDMQIHGIPDEHYINRIDNEGFCTYTVRKWHAALQHVQYDFDKLQMPLFNFVRAFMSSSYAETLFKQGRLQLFKYCAENNLFGSKEFVAAMRIALRHKYDIEKDVTLWCDYVQTLLKLKKDVHNAVYVCPKDLHAAHDLYLQRWRKIEAEKQRKLDEKRKLEKVLRAKMDNEAYIKRMQPFLGLLFTDGKGISLHVLRDVSEFAEEAAVMQHCVFDNEYYKKPQSLIMSAQVNGERTETVEVSLADFTIQQSRGHRNYPSKYHKRIVQLVRNSLPMIKQAACAG